MMKRREADLFRVYVAPSLGASNWPFVKDQLWRMNSFLWPAVMSEYVRTVNEAAYSEPKDVKRQNAAACAGNVYIRECSEKMARGNKNLSIKLYDIMSSGPERKCSTCKNWRYEIEGEYFQGCRAGMASEGVHGVCEEWSSRV